MRRRLRIILVAIVASGPTLSVLAVAYVQWGRLVAGYVDTTWAIVWIVCACVALMIACDRALQILKLRAYPNNLRSSYIR